MTRLLKFMYNTLSLASEIPPDSGIRENSTDIFLRKAGHVVPTPFLVRVNCSVTIIAAQSLQLRAVSDNFQFYFILPLFSRNCFHCNFCCSVSPFQCVRNIKRLRVVHDQIEILKINSSIKTDPTRFF